MINTAVVNRDVMINVNQSNKNVFKTTSQQMAGHNSLRLVRTTGNGSGNFYDIVLYAWYY